jgi:DNA-binding CsgD family transcriptional regulator
VVRAADPDYLAAMSYVLGPGGPEPPTATIFKDGVSQEDVQQMVASGWAASSPEDAQRVAAAARKPGINSLRLILGDSAIDRWLEQRTDWPVALVDAVAVLLPGPEGKPVLLTLACAKPRRFQGAELALWHRTAIHLGAGWRLAGRAGDVEADDVEAILTPNGEVTHASGAGTSVQSRETLRRATRDIDRARSRSGRADPLAALELWQGLLAGRWSLVEHFDTDGKRFLLARRNELAVPDPRALTPRQRQVVFHASLGLSTKETAYALGLAENTVSAHLAAGLARLGIASRAALVRMSSELASEALTALR